MSIQDIKIGENIENLLCAITSISTGITKTDKEYMRFVLSDNSGEIQAVCWDLEKEFKELKEGQVVEVEGTCNEYREEKQFKITNIKPTSKDYDISVLLPVEQNINLDKLELKFSNFINKRIKNLTLSWTVRYLLNKVWDKYKRVPASSKIHHNYLGGLLCHVCQMLEIAEQVICVWPDLNSDLIYSGIILHDFGKVWEYEIVPGFPRSDFGKLNGHICICWGEIYKSIDEGKKYFETLDWIWDDNLIAKLQSIIVTHHGNRDWGSPEIPKFAEATVVFALDLLSARTEGYLSLIRKSSNAWTPRISYYDTE